MPNIFWSKYPSLLYGISAFIASCCALYAMNSVVVTFLAILFLLPFISIPFTGILEIHRRLVLALAIGYATFCYINTQHVIPTIPSKDLLGIAHFNLTAITHSKTLFGPMWNYKGVLHSFISNDGIEVAKNIPITLSIPSNPATTRPLTTHHYRALARLKNNGTGRFSLGISKNTPWEPFDKALSIAEWRFQAKTNVKQHVYDAIHDQHTAAFLTGIATGEFDDRILSFELGRFGLQHLMAISGLHFAIIASILGFVLQMIFSRKVAAVMLIGMLSAYFIFLGPSPSVIRAWIAIAITLCGVIIGKRGAALNSLGIALLVISLYDPLSASNIGFQFSFAVTAAILLWFSPCDVLWQKVFAKRRLSQIVEMGSLNQHGYCMLFFLRQAMALALAVNLVALPLTLYHFHKFPLMSLVYNVFFPLMMSLCLLLLITAMLFSLFLPFVGEFIHAINEGFTRFLLSFAFNLPKSYDLTIRTSEFSQNLLILYLIVIFLGGIFAKEWIEKREVDLT